MSVLKFPELNSRFVRKDAPPKGVEVREVFGHTKKSEGAPIDGVVSCPVKNPVEGTKTIPLDDFNKNYKLI